MPFLIKVWGDSEPFEWAEAPGSVPHFESHASVFVQNDRKDQVVIRAPLAIQTVVPFPALRG